MHENLVLTVTLASESSLIASGE